MNYPGTKIRDLPVYKHKDLILAALEKSQVVVVESPTGSGKTTQLPVILHQAGYSGSGVIGVTQPRRIAALSVSEFIARQMECPLGTLVGYKMRFEDRTTQNTRIKIMTDGILLQEMKLDPWLSKYNCLVVDEAHERSLTIDFILGLLKRVLEERRDFKVIVSSATINAEVFSEYFGECPVVKIDAQTYPVTLIYDPPAVEGISAEGNLRASGAASPPRFTAPFSANREFDAPQRDDPRRRFSGGQIAAEALLAKITAITERVIGEKYAAEKGPRGTGGKPAGGKEAGGDISGTSDSGGDILIFLPGEKMIKDCMTSLAFSPVGKHLHILPLYGRLGKEEQERVFDPAPEGKTKVVISTNIAETSVTIDGITAVLDSGLSKLNHYNPRTFTSSLVEAPISKASANQRKGRAGRTREGTCYRLYARRDFESRPLFTTEEIYRTDLSEVALRMADLGITTFEEFDFISPPSKEGFIAAIETLNLLDALESDHSLSATGKLMTEFPLPPRHSRIIVEAILKYPRVVKETVIAAAFLSTQSPYILPPGEETDARRAHHRFRDEDGDFVSYLKLYEAYTEASSKQKFCEKNYLDERAMAEIANVTNQLEETVSGMNIPVLAGGSREDYLCAVARGLIQFVCVRDGRELYRSLTAERILIHPGSVMFRMNPDFIVAGEIVRTTRMYAMSVSPLPFRTLEKISPALVSSLGADKGRRRPEGKSGGANRGPADYNSVGKSADNYPAGIYPSEERTRLKKARDFTSNIKIGGEVFEIETVKGRKQVKLPWEKLKTVTDNIRTDTAAMYKGLRGIITVADKYTLLGGEKLALILQLAPSLEIETAPERKSFRKATLSSGENLDELLEILPGLVKPALWKHGKKELGFTGLFTDNEGNYWMRCSRGFHTSLSESLASVESLIDELGDDVDIEKKHIVNRTYRRLSEYLGVDGGTRGRGTVPQ